VQNLTKELIAILAQCSAKLEKVSGEMTDKKDADYVMHLTEQIENILYYEFKMTHDEIDYEVSKYIETT